jgi:hypothetical protein
MDAWLETFGKLNAEGKYYLPTSDQSLVVSILSAGVSISYRRWQRTRLMARTFSVPSWLVLSVTWSVVDGVS